MTRLSFDTVETLIYDPVSANRTATRAALYALGFRRTETVGSFEGFLDTVRKRPLDLVLCEAQGAGMELCEAIQHLRQGAQEGNPFMVVIVTAWEKSTALARRVVDSGADDLLLRPFSTGLLGSRIETHIERRKSFIITSEYVGPDRRGDMERASDAESFAPPNSLKIKAKEKLSTEALGKRLDQEMRAARDLLSIEKLRRDSFQVCILWRLMQDHRIGAALIASDLAKLAGIAKSIERRCRESEHDGAVEWCDSIIAAAEGLELGVDRNASMHLLGQAALGLQRVFHPEKSPTDILAGIDASVAIIRARGQKALAS